MADTFSFPTEEYVLIGKVTKAHGIKGEVKLLAFSGTPKSITQHTDLFLISTENYISPAFAIRKARIGKKEIIVHLHGVSDRNHADKLRGHGVLVYKKDLPLLNEDEFYLYELEGSSVQTVDGEIIGTVTNFSSNGVQDILVITNKTDEYLVPLIPGMITRREENLLTIAPPPGLLAINSGRE